MALCFITDQLSVVLLATGFCGNVLYNRSFISPAIGHDVLLHCIP